MRKPSKLFDDIQFDDEFSQFIEKLLQNFANNPKLHMKKDSFQLSVANKHGETLLHFAAKNNKKENKELDENEMRLQKEFIRFLLRGGANVNSLNNHGQSALDYALKDRLYPLASILIKWGADIENRLEGKTWLYRAVEEEDFVLAEFLLKKGANCQAKREKDYYKESPLHLVAQKKLPESWWKLFIDYGAGIMAPFPLWKEYKLDYEKFVPHSFLYRFRINSGQEMCYVSRKFPGFEKSCTSIAELEQSIKQGVKYNLKAFIRAINALKSDPTNPLLMELTNNLRRLKMIQDGKHHLRVKPLTTLALKQLLLKPTVELPEEIFNRIEDKVDTFEGKLNKRN